MTDKIIAALIAYLSDTITDVPVVFAQTQEDLTLPCIVVNCESTEQHSRSIFKAKVLNMSITYMNHAEDETEIEQTATTDTIQSLIFNPPQLKSDLNTVIADGVYIDHVQFDLITPQWEDATYAAPFQGVIVAQYV